MSDRYTVKHDIVFGCRQCLMIFGGGEDLVSQNIHKTETQNIQAQEKPPLIHSTRRLKLGNPSGVKGVIINGLLPAMVEMPRTTPIDNSIWVPCKTHAGTGSVSYNTQGTGLS